MRTSAPGNPEVTRPQSGNGWPLGHQHGFTLLELLVVVTLIALASTGIGFSLREGPDQGLEREAQRLSALLSAGHAQARMQGVPRVWQSGQQGFELDGRFHPWLQPGTMADPPQLTLGPEPMLPPTRLALRHGGQAIWLVTDGLRPFSPSPTPELGSRP